MAYCRFGSSDAYVYATMLEGRQAWHCCGCSINEDALFYSRRVMVAHLKKHVSIGEKIPQWTFDRFAREIEEHEQDPE